jgi:uncharacterized iron-regulated membrane protein
MSIDPKRQRRLRRWSWLHRWSSLICTPFILLLCITGLPLIFHHEIDRVLYPATEPEPLSANMPAATLDRIVAAGLAHFPGQAVHFIVWEADEPNVVMLDIGASPGSDPALNRTVRVAAQSAQVLDAPETTSRLTALLLRLHADLFLGLPGKLLLGVTGILFCLSIVSGAVLYLPSMRKLSFGAYRHHRAHRVRHLDLHNLAGIVTTAWALAVGLTGVVNSSADIVVRVWQVTQLAEIAAAAPAHPPALEPVSVQRIVNQAQAMMPDRTPRFVAFPGSYLTSDHHYAVYMRGTTPLTARLITPVFFDANDGAFVGSPPLPWYVTALLLSQPLHFGDYGGWPLKIIWALIDVLTAVVLVTGVQLWAGRRRVGSRALLPSRLVRSR